MYFVVLYCVVLCVFGYYLVDVEYGFDYFDGSWVWFFGFWCVVVDVGMGCDGGVGVVVFVGCVVVDRCVGYCYFGC